MIMRSNLAEQLKEYQIRSKHYWASVSFFSSTTNLPSSRFICNHNPLVETIWSSCGTYINLIKWSNCVHFPNTNVHQAEVFDSKVGTNLLDIILTKMEKVFLILPKVSSWTTKIKHVDDNVGSLKVKLIVEDLKEITDDVTINEVAGARIHAEIELYSWRFVNTHSNSNNASEQDS